MEAIAIKGLLGITAGLVYGMGKFISIALGANEHPVAAAVVAVGGDAIAGLFIWACLSV